MRLDDNFLISRLERIKALISKKKINDTIIFDFNTDYELCGMFKQHIENKNFNVWLKDQDIKNSGSFIAGKVELKFAQ